jgi:hypothetical protein
MGRAKLELRVNEVGLPGDGEKLAPANHSYYVYTDEKGRQESIGVYSTDIPPRLDAQGGEYKKDQPNYPPDGELSETYSIEIDTKGRPPVEVFKDIKKAYQQYEDAELLYTGLGSNCNASAYSAGIAAGIEPRIPPNTNRATPGFGVNLNHAVELTNKAQNGSLPEKAEAYRDLEQFYVDSLALGVVQMGAYYGQEGFEYGVKQGEEFLKNARLNTKHFKEEMKQIHEQLYEQSGLPRSFPEALQNAQTNIKIFQKQFKDAVDNTLKDLGLNRSPQDILDTIKTNLGLNKDQKEPSPDQSNQSNSVLQNQIQAPDGYPYFQTFPSYQAAYYYGQQQQFPPQYFAASHDYRPDPIDPEFTNSQPTDLSEFINQYSSESEDRSLEFELQELSFALEETAAHFKQLSETTANTTASIRETNESISRAFQSSIIPRTLSERDLQSTRESERNQLPDSKTAISGNEADVNEYASASLGYEYPSQQQSPGGIERER